MKFLTIKNASPIQFLFLSFFLFSCKSQEQPHQFLKNGGLCIEPSEKLTLDYKFQSLLGENRVLDIFHFRSGPIEIHITARGNITRQQADLLIEDKVIEVESTYSSKPSPYYASIFKDVSCDQSLKPKHHISNTKTEKNLIFNAFSNKNNNWNVCLKSEANKKVLLSLLYCKNATRFFEVGQYLDKNLPNPFLKLSCCKNNQ
jgi:hypothetical protein